MPECKTEVTTNSGTFTFYSESVPSFRAKILCAEKGAILAPFTNQEDINAVKGILDLKCDFYKRNSKYHIGLKVKKCENKQARLFSNNVVWNQAKHGSLYTDVLRAPIICPLTFLRHDGSLMIADGKQFCDTGKFGYVCLKQAN